MIEEEYGTPDDDNPEWTAGKFARSIKFKDLPESLQRILSRTQQKRMRGSFAALEDDGEEQATANANADFLRE